MIVIHPYRAVQTLIQDNTNVKIVRLTFHKNTARPAKNRDTERCISVGNASTTVER